MLTRIVFGLALTVVVPATLAALAGATPGSFSVNQNGGATYTIPITAPPGSAGIAPGIALTDSKQVDNPLVGALDQQTKPYLFVQIRKWRAAYARAGSPSQVEISWRNTPDSAIVGAG